MGGWPNPSCLASISMGPAPISTPAFARSPRNGSAFPFKFIANDGNFVVNPIDLMTLDEQGIAERYDIVVDFSQCAVGEQLYLVNRLRMRDDGRGPDGSLSLGAALAGDPEDPVIGAIMQFRIVDSVPSVDAPGATLTIANSCGTNDRSQVPNGLTEQIPIVTPVRTRLVEFGRSGDGDSRGPDGQCTPDCPEDMPFPWTIKVNGEDAHSFNANRISLLVPRPGEIEHWTYVNGGGGWDHPIHLHFEEGLTLYRGRQESGFNGRDPIPATERFVRKETFAPPPFSTGRTSWQNWARTATGSRCCSFRSTANATRRRRSSPTWRPSTRASWR